jgi:hypothetical protein
VSVPDTQQTLGPRHIAVGTSHPDHIGDKITKRAWAVSDVTSRPSMRTERATAQTGQVRVSAQISDPRTVTITVSQAA